jgi:hypothetical protein
MECDNVQPTNDINIADNTQPEQDNHGANAMVAPRLIVGDLTSDEAVKLCAFTEGDIPLDDEIASILERVANGAAGLDKEDADKKLIAATGGNPEPTVSESVALIKVQEGDVEGDIDQVALDACINKLTGDIQTNPNVVYREIYNPPVYSEDSSDDESDDSADDDRAPPADEEQSADSDEVPPEDAPPADNNKGVVDPGAKPMIEQMSRLQLGWSMPKCTVM